MVATIIHTENEAWIKCHFVVDDLSYLWTVDVGGHDITVTPIFNSISGGIQIGVSGHYSRIIGDREAFYVTSQK